MDHHISHPLTNFEPCILPAFTVIGREGSTRDGEGFIQRLWAEANAHFAEIEPLVKRNPDGTPAGFWGAMSDPTRAFKPWSHDFTEGLYLAGAECVDGAEPPEGWEKWIVPAYEYLKVENDGPDSFRRALESLAENHLTLAGAVHDFSDPCTGKDYHMIPIRKI